MSDTAYAPWMDDADAPEEELTKEQLEKLVEGVRKLMDEPPPANEQPHEED